MSLSLGHRDVTPEDLRDVARAGTRVSLDPQVLDRLAAGRALVERYEAEGRAVYGLTRGLGRQVTSEVGEAARDGFSRAVVLGRAGGAGPWLERDQVRAALFARVASIARGGSGVRPVLAERLAAMLNAGLHPRVPAIGSVGAADIALMANLALPLIGEGRAEIGGELLPGAEAMARAGLEPLDLASKEGLALCSANAISTGQGSLAAVDAATLLDRLESIIALTFEAFRANLSPIDPRVAAARPAPGQAVSAAALRDKMRGSRLFVSDEPRRVQDPISLRCVSQVHGALRIALEAARACLSAELNGAGDNPVVLTDEGEIFSNGNFHTPATAIAFDALNLALLQVASLSAERTRRLLSEELTGLADRLTRHGPTRIGLSVLSFTATTLAKEIRDLAQPASLDNQSSYDVEDHAPMTPRATRKTAEILGHLRQVMACELIVAGQAFELRELREAAPLARAVFDALRGAVEPFDDDRALTEDLERATALIAGEEFVSLRS